MSNSTVDFQRILATSPTTEKPQPEPKPHTPDSLVEEEHPPKVSPRKKKRAFQGVLDAAIAYFSEKQAVYVPSLPPAVDTGNTELSELRSELHDLESQIKEMEDENEELRIKNQSLTAQKETFALTIGSLNTKILDLQLLQAERNAKKTNSEPVKKMQPGLQPIGSITGFRDDSGSLDISEIKSENVQKTKPREEPRKPEAKSRRQEGRFKGPISFS